MNIIQSSTPKGLSGQSQAVSSILKLAVVAGFALLTGCSGMVNIGASDFNCPSPDGVQCKSAREIYGMTHDGAVPAPDTATKKRGFFSKKKTPAEVTESADVQQATTSTNDNQTKEGGKPPATETDTVVDNYVAPRLPDRPVPIRTPAHVMRIWVAPWEDTNGDLITNGYVYTEIEPRRWVVGKPESVGAPVLRPLQRIQARPIQPPAGAAQQQ